MRREGSLVNALLLFMTVACLACCAAMSRGIREVRCVTGLISPMPKMTLVEVPLDQFAGAALMTGFRGIVADLLWLECDELWHRGEWHKLLPYYYFITRLQPRFVTVWAIGAWHMAYNVSHRVSVDAEIPNAERPLESARWVDRGIAFLKEGLAYNADRFDLYFELGWTYYNKVNDSREAAIYLEKAAARPHPPVVDRLLAHAYQACGKYREAYAIWERIEREAGGKDGPARRFMHELKTYLSEGK